MNKLLRINPNDNVAVALHPIAKGETIEGITIEENITQGHKVALSNIRQGDNVIKYGFPIGHATHDIPGGFHVHTKNLSTNLSDKLSYEYVKSVNPYEIKAPNSKFMGYRREDGQVGIRNEIWIIPTVSCVNRNIELIARLANEKYSHIEGIDGIYEFKHPYGCSQMGDDQENTINIICSLINHPNAAGVLVMGLGCENCSLDVIRKHLRKWDDKRVKFLAAQDVPDDLETGIELIRGLADYASGFIREPIDVFELKIGLKCGGSDGLSGITANPLTGRFSDIIVCLGGTTVLTEVPEMFGAETILMGRAQNKEVFEKIVLLINNFKDYYISHNQVVYENPSPGNKDGGITTLEEKSIGCVQKGGTSEIVDVIGYGDKLLKKGVNLLQGPGNDFVSITAMAAAGCHMILFTTGRGTPMGTCVPTVKISTNNELYNHKPQWMDFNAGGLLSGKDMDTLSHELFEYIINIASGAKSKNEILGFREITIFKTGVTL